MPLPFGGKPEDSPIYSDMKTKKLSELSATDFDSFRARMFSEGINGLEDEYRRLLLLGMASDKISLSGPMPGTAKLIQVETTSSGDQVFFVPNSGEAWAVLAASTGATVNGTLVLELVDATSGVTVEIGQETGANTAFTPTSWSQAFIDENVYLQCHFSGTSSTSQCVAAFIRVR